MRAFTTICALIAVPLVAFAGDDAAKKAPAAGAPAPVKQAEPAPPPPAPTPAKELDAAKPYAKAWSCTGNGADKEKAKFSWKLDLDKFWYTVRMDGGKPKTGTAFTGVGYVGIDPISKNWAFIGFDNRGGWINLKAAAAAFTADGVVFEGDANDPRGKAPAKFSFKHDAKAKTMSFFGEIGGQKVFDYTCK